MSEVRHSAFLKKTRTGPLVTVQEGGKGFKLKEGRFGLDFSYGEETLYCKRGEKQVAMRSCGCPTPEAFKHGVCWMGV